MIAVEFSGQPLVDVRSPAEVVDCLPRLRVSTVPGVLPVRVALPFQQF
jgi:hypothetical protein